MTDNYRHVNQQKSVNLIDKCWLIVFLAVLQGGPPKGTILPNHGVRVFQTPKFRFVPKPRSGVFMEDITIVHGVYNPTKTTNGSPTLYPLDIGDYHNP